MKRARWVFGAVAVAGAVVLVAPAAGQGKAASASLKWTRSRGGPTVVSYDVGGIDAGSSLTRWFRLGSSSTTKSGKLAINLTGSPSFSIMSDRCTGKSIGPKLSCWVSVLYGPLGGDASAGATLTATADHGAVARLSLSGFCSDHQSGPHLYWGDANDGGIEKVPIFGGCVTAVASGLPSGLAVHGGYVYFSNAANGTVDKVPVGGGSVTILASGQRATSVAVDGTHVYWVNGGTYSNGRWESNGTVNEVPIGGGTVTTLAGGVAYPTAVAVQGTHVYWADWGNGDGTVNAVPLAGGSVTTLASGQKDLFSLAVDATHVYFGAERAVNEVPIGGGPVTTLATDTGGYWPTSLAVDGAHVYWTDGWVQEVPVGGGPVTTLALGSGNSLVVDRWHVYWGAGGYYEQGGEGGPTAVPGSVNAIPLIGGGVNTLATLWPDSAPVLAIGP